MTPAVRFSPPDAKTVQLNKKEEDEEEEESSAGHHFYWQLVNKLTKRDAGASPPPPPSSLSPLLLTTGAPPPNFFFLEMMNFSGAGISRRVVFHSISLQACIWVLPQRGEIPWAGKLSSWTINHGSELIFDSKLWWGTLNRAGLPADTWIESLKVQHTRRRWGFICFYWSYKVFLKAKLGEKWRYLLGWKWEKDTYGGFLGYCLS